MDRRKRRLILLLIPAALALALIAARLAVLQIGQAKYWQAQAQNFGYRHYVIPTRRGQIVDCRGRYLAIPAPCYNLAIQYQAMNLDDHWITRLAQKHLESRYPSRRLILEHLERERQHIVQALRHLPQAICRRCDLPLADVLQRFDQVRARMQSLREDIWVKHYRRHENFAGADTSADVAMQLSLANHIDLAEAHEAHTIVADIPSRVAYYFKKHADRYPGLVIVPSTHQVYPFGSTAAQVIGTMRQVTPAVLKQDPFVLPQLIANTWQDTTGDLKGYLPGDEIGASGVEKMAERLLRGTRGVKLVSLAGQEIQTDRRQPIPGRTIHLTLDIKLQQTLQMALQNPSTNLLYFNGQMHSTAVVVLSIKNNQVLVMLSQPGYDLNDFHQNFTQLIQDPARPLLNRPIAAIYPPGSTVKPLVAAFALHDAVITPQTVIDCGAYLYPGRPDVFRNWTYPNAPGPLTLVDAIEQSCDTYFYNVGIWLGLKRMVDGYREFGLGQATGVGLPDETSGFLPAAPGANPSAAERTNAIFLSIGQGPIAVTVLQMANAYATLLRGGIWMAPQLIEDFPRPAPRRVSVDPSAIATIRQGMELVVQGPRGTASALRMAIPVAGKTGTAQTSRRVLQNGRWTVVKGDDGWFVGYVPANDPQYVIAAVAPMSGEGGSYAAPIVRQCILDMEQYGYLPKLDRP